MNTTLQPDQTKASEPVSLATFTTLPLNEKLRVLMPQVDKVAERRQRFAHFLEASGQWHPEIPQLMQEMEKRDSVDFEPYWSLTIGDFKRWWDDALRAKRKNAGLKRGAKRTNAKGRKKTLAII